VRGGRACGVALQSGEEIEAGSVASNLDPKLTFLKLLDERDLDADFVAAIRHYRIEGTSCKINLALNGLPEFTAYPGVVFRRRFRARPASSRHHAHLPEHRIRGARLGRR
jgi:phytoene dehydrogenase-like protein